MTEYEALLRSFWESCSRGDLSAVTSELTLLETLVVPLRTGNRDLEHAHEDFLLRGDLRLAPIDRQVLR